MHLPTIQGDSQVTNESTHDMFPACEPHCLESNGYPPKASKRGKNKNRNDQELTTLILLRRMNATPYYDAVRR